MKPTKCSFALLTIIAGLLLAALLIGAGCGGTITPNGDPSADRSTMVKPPKTPPDTTPPAAVTDLDVTGLTYCSADLAWTATGDDGSEGQASSYDIRYAVFEITEENWANAEEVYGEPAPLPAGEAEVFTVHGLDSDTTYYFALKVTDDAGNISGISRRSVNG